MTVTLTENPNELKTVTIFHQLMRHWVSFKESNSPELNEVYQAMEELAHRAAFMANSGDSLTVSRIVTDNAVVAYHKDTPVYIIELPH